MEKKTNDKGQQVQVTTRTSIETRDFTTIAKEYFQKDNSDSQEWSYLHFKSVIHISIIKCLKNKYYIEDKEIILKNAKIFYIILGEEKKNKIESCPSWVLQLFVGLPRTTFLLL